MEENPSFWFLLLSHHSYPKLSHTFHVRYRGRSIYLCARCTGVGIGILAGLFYLNTLANTLNRYPLLVFALVLPSIFDWLLQVFRVRESTNPRRLLTGALVGQAYLIGIVAFLRGWYSLLAYYALGFALLSVSLYILFRATGVMDEYLAKAWPR